MIFIKNQAFRVTEKVPGVNFLQIAPIGGLNFLMIPKCGTRTIRNILLSQEGLIRKIDAFSHIRYISRNILFSEYNSSKTIVTIRHPLHRLLSCWKQKVSDQRDSGLFYFWQYYPLLRPNMSFCEFLIAVSKVPIVMREKHFIPLGYFFNSQSATNFSFIGLPMLNAEIMRITGIDMVEVANSTHQISCSSEAIDIFNSLLQQDYLWELKMYEACATQ